MILEAKDTVNDVADYNGDNFNTVLRAKSRAAKSQNQINAFVIIAIVVQYNIMAMIGHFIACEFVKHLV